MSFSSFINHFNIFYFIGFYFLILFLYYLFFKTINVTLFLLVSSFNNTYGLKQLPLPFQINIDKDLL